MPDPTLARAFAGASFRRADSERDERAAERPRLLEDFLRGLRGWLPPGRESRRSIARFDDAVQAVALALRDADDAAVADRLKLEMRGLKAASARLHRDPRLAAIFACIGEASRRRLGLWPHPVQFTGARVLLGGCLAEMQTGEGKTLVAALAATAMAASGASVHVVSANDYLASRDCAEMRPLFEFFGLTGAVVEGDMEPADRQAAYRHDICYVAGKELVFDYLKDRLAGHGTLPARVTRLRRLWVGAHGAVADEPIVPALHFAIVDEADSVLIDEARTPMILSRETPGIYRRASCCSGRSNRREGSSGASTSGSARSAISSCCRARSSAARRCPRACAAPGARRRGAS